MQIGYAEGYGPGSKSADPYAGTKYEGTGGPRTMNPVRPILPSDKNLDLASVLPPTQSREFKPSMPFPGAGQLTMASPMMGGIGGLFSRLQGMDDEAFNRGLDRYGQFQERFGGGFQPNMFGSFARMDDEGFNRGMDRLSQYAQRFGSGNPMFRNFRMPQPASEGPGAGGQNPFPEGTAGDTYFKEYGELPPFDPDIADRGVVGPQPSYQPYASQPPPQGFYNNYGRGPATQPYYNTTFGGASNPYAGGYGMGYNNPYGSSGGMGGGKGGGNPYRSQPAGAGKGGANNMGTYNMMSA